MLCTGWLVYALSFLTMIPPKFECLKSDGSWFVCSRETACEGGGDFWVDYSAEYSFHNLIGQYDLHCASDATIGAIGGMIFLGWTSLSLVIPVYADKLGRHTVLLISFSVTTAGLVPILVFTDIRLLLCCTFLVGLFGTGRIGVSLIYMTECLTPYWRLVAVTVHNVFHCVQLLIAVFVLKYVTHNTGFLLVIGSVTGLGSVLGAVFWLEESPIFLLKTGKDQQAIAVIRRTHRVNNPQEPLICIDQILAEELPSQPPSSQSETSKAHQSALAMLRTTPRLLTDLCIMVSMWSIISFNYYLLTFQIKSLPGDVFANTVATAMSETAGVLGGGLLVKQCGLKNAFVYSYGVSLVGSLAIVFFAGGLWRMAFWCIVTRIGISALFNIIYLANLEMFPTMFAASAMGLCNFIARIVTIMAPVLAEEQGDTGMLVHGTLCALGMVLATFL